MYEYLCAVYDRGRVTVDLVLDAIQGSNVSLVALIPIVPGS